MEQRCSDYQQFKLAHHELPIITKKIHKLQLQYDGVVAELEASMKVEARTHNNSNLVLHTSPLNASFILLECHMFHDARRTASWRVRSRQLCKLS